MINNKNSVQQGFCKSGQTHSAKIEHPTSPPSPSPKTLVAII